MRKLSFIFCLILFIVSCSKKRSVPKGILPQKEMGAVLWDLVKAGEFLDAFVFTKDSLIDRGATGIEWYNEVFRLHKINKAQFEKSYDYYQNHPDLMREVLDTLSKKQFVRPTPPGQGVPNPDSVKKDTQARFPIAVPVATKDSVKLFKKRRITAK